MASEVREISRKMSGSRSSSSVNWQHVRHSCSRSYSGDNGKSAKNPNLASIDR